MHRALDVDGDVPVAGEVGRLREAGGHARREQLAVPDPVVRLGDRAGRLAVEHAAEAGEHGLVRLPVAAGGERVAVRPVFRAAVGVPVAAPHPVDQGRADLVALDGERMVGVRRVDVRDVGEHGVDVGGAAGRRRKAVEDAPPHGVPRQAQAPDDRVGVPAEGPREGVRGTGRLFGRRGHRSARVQSACCAVRILAHRAECGSRALASRIRITPFPAASISRSRRVSGGSGVAVVMLDLHE